MRYGQTRPERPRRRLARENRLAVAPAGREPGPRLLSARQQAHRLRAAPPGSRGRAAEEAASWSERAWARARRRNRRRRDLWRIALRVSLLLLVVECAAALLLSPRLWVRTVRVEGNQRVTAERLFERLRLRPRTNIVSLPVGRLRDAVEKEPVVARAEIHRRLPGTLTVRVWERSPWAVVKTGGICYTVDETLVPFRKDRVPRPDLPLLALEKGGGAEVRLGKRIVAAGTAEAIKCLNWAAAREDFPLEKVRVDQTGKLCLNRKGGAEVWLGSGVDLDRKLNALAILLARRADVRDGSFAYINLFAFDAPAIFPRLDPSSPPGESAAAPDRNAGGDGNP